jgi:serine/threonine protein kinase
MHSPTSILHEEEFYVAPWTTGEEINISCEEILSFVKEKHFNTLKSKLENTKNANLFEADMAITDHPKYFLKLRCWGVNEENKDGILREKIALEALKNPVVNNNKSPHDQAVGQKNFTTSVVSFYGYIDSFITLSTTLFNHRFSILILEKINGITLQAYMDLQVRNVVDSWNLRLNIATGICEGLKYIHDNGYGHNDISPHNIMINEESSRAVIIDFGASSRYIPPGEQMKSMPKLRAGGRTQVVDSKMQVKGTPGYTATEKLSSVFKGSSFDIKAADIYRYSPRSRGIQSWTSLILSPFLMTTTICK